MQRLVHLDLKGAPPRPGYLTSLFPLLKTWGASGVCIEWEDMLPFEGRLEVIRNRHAYSRKAVAALLSGAREAGLAVVPLVQTFGHLEFLLKHEAFAEYREDPDALADIRPTHPGSLSLIGELLDQVIALHPGIETIHLGGDEVWSLGNHPETRRLIASEGRDAAYLKHMLPLVKQAGSHGLRAMLWDDMMREWPVRSLAQLAGTTDLVLWRYGDDITRGLPSDTLARYRTAGLRVWGASAFKGACGPDAIWPDFAGRIRNHAAWAECAGTFELSGLILTGWSRYHHFSTLCELIPAGLPALALSLEILNRGHFSDPMRKGVFESLGIGDMPFIHKKTEDLISLPPGNFPGGEAFRLLGKLQAARQLMWFVNEDVSFHFPKKNGGRHDPGRARRMIRRADWAQRIAGEVEKDLPPALRKILFPRDIREFMQVQVTSLMANARRAIAAGEKVLKPGAGR